MTGDEEELEHQKHRCRPLWSKNKPKPPVFITRDSPDALRSHVLEVSPGADVVACVAEYARRRGSGVCVLSASGAVSDVAVRGAAAPLRGRFELLSVTGIVLPPPAPPEASGLAVKVSDGQGQVFGRCVVGPLVAAGPVTIFVTTFSNAVYERLPLPDAVKPDLSTAAAEHPAPTLYTDIQLGLSCKPSSFVGAGSSSGSGDGSSAQVNVDTSATVKEKESPVMDATSTSDWMDDDFSFGFAP